MSQHNATEQRSTDLKTNLRYGAYVQPMTRRGRPPLVMRARSVRQVVRVVGEGDGRACDLQWLPVLLLCTKL